MAVKECYEKIGGDYEEVLSRLPGEAFVLRFLKKFVSDGSYQALCEAMEQGDAGSAFRASHTLKGICQNLGFTELYRYSSELTELLRTGSLDHTEELMRKVKENYELTVSAIEEIVSTH